jgi:hypothetical protein
MATKPEMAIKPPYRVSYEGDDIVVRLKRAALTRNQVSRFLDYVMLEAVRTQSQLTEAQAADLAKDINRRAWERIQSRIDLPDD